MRNKEFEMTIAVSPEMVPQIVAEAEQAAKTAAAKFFKERLGG